MIPVSRNSLWRFETAQDFEACTHDATVTVDPATGRVALRKSILVANEHGAILHRRSEELSRFVCARKFLHLEQLVFEKATLIFFAFQYINNAQPLHIEVNGHVVAYQNEAGRGCFAWHTVILPLDWLCEGENVILFRGNSPSFNTWALAIDNLSRQGCSEKSYDCGLTWQDNYLGYDGSIQGEYLVRLRLECYPSQGSILSPVIDLAGDEIPPNHAQFTLCLDVKARTPKKTQISFQVRHTPSCNYNSFEWSEWQDYPIERGWLEPLHRFVQWRAILSTEDILITPSLVSIAIRGKPLFSRTDWISGVHLKARADRTPIASSLPFIYQDLYEQKLDLLREQEHLERLVSETKSEFDKFLLLRHWVASQWTWHNGVIYSPWDALVILDWQRGTRSKEYKGAPVGFLSHGGCIHFSLVYIQCCLALGLQARGVALDAAPPPPDQSHFVTEVWSNEYEKWIVMDPTTDVHFVRRGTPLGGLEMHELWKQNRASEVEQIEGSCTEAFPLGRTWAIDEYRKGGYRFYAIVPRNNHLSSLSPSPIDHGQSTYHEDAYIWYGDMALEGQPWFSLYSTRRADFLWALNQVKVDLASGEASGELLVLLNTFTPNLARFEVNLDSQGWSEVRNTVIWKLHSGLNLLETRAINVLGVSGPVSRMQVDYGSGRGEME